MAHATNLLQASLKRILLGCQKKSLAYIWGMLIAVHITKYVVALVGEGLRVSCIIAFRRVLPFAAGA